VIPRPTKFAIVLHGERLIAAAVRRDRVETFIVEAEQPATALRAELDARKLSPRKVAVGLPRASVTVKPIELPPVAGAVRDMVRFELERHLPFPADDAPFDFVPLVYKAEGQALPTEGQRVLVAAAERRLVDAALRLADEARLRPISVTVAAHDLVGLVHADRQGRVAWVHRTGKIADLLFVVGGTIVLSRAVPAADESLIADEIKRSLTMLRWRTCDAIWISGDVEAPGAPTSTALTGLGAPVTAPPYTARARRLLSRNDGPPGGASELAIAVAARRRARPLDLIPDARRPRRLSRTQLATLGTLAATLILVLAALLYPGYRTTRYLASVNTDITEQASEVRAVERVLQEVERKRRLLATIESIGASSVRPLPVLRELTELIPADAWLTALSVDSKGVELTGQAGAASALIPLLENSPQLERVEFASPVTRGREKEQFRIRATWEAPGGGRARTASVPPDATVNPPLPAPVGPAGTAARARAATPDDPDDDGEVATPTRRPVAPARPPATGPR
jgi:Tfp pilus assembly protein PilN